MMNYHLAELCVLEATAVLVSKVRGKNIFLISIYNRSEHQRIAAELSRIFERLDLNRPHHEFIVGGDFNALHTDWGYHRTRERGRVCGTHETILRDQGALFSVPFEALEGELSGPIPNQGHAGRPSD